MEETIEDKIRQNGDFRQALLAQEGGIMKYWAEHPDADFDINLYDGYEQQIVDAYLRANRRSRTVAALPKNVLKREARNWYHLTEKELHYQAALQPVLARVSDGIAKQVNRYIDDYLVDAYDDYLRCCYPDGIPPIELYKGLIESYRQGHRAFDCLMHMLRERHAQTECVKSERDRLDEFLIWQSSEAVNKNGGYKKLRRAVREMLEGKTDKECRRIAICEMNKVGVFSRVINDDNSKFFWGNDYELTAADREWLRDVVSHYQLFSKQKVSHLHSSFASYVNLLSDIGHIWAAQLLVHHIDMHELEKETHAILHPVSKSGDEFDYNYYVDKDSGDQPGDCCVYDKEQAKELLEKIKHGWDNSKGEVLMWTDRAKQCFQKAVTKGWMKYENGKYSWCGVKPKPSGKPSKSELAYFLGKVYGYKFENGNNVGARLPASELNDYFGFGKKSVTDTLLQLYRGGNKQPYMPIIDDFFNELTQH